MTETRLKPCPFCGGKAKLTDLKQAPESWVECTECGAGTRLFSNSEEAAVSAWNTRPIEDELDEEIKRLREALEKIVIETNEYERRLPGPSMVVIRLYAEKALKGGE